MNVEQVPPIHSYPPLAKLIGWLILSHHKLPTAADKSAVNIEYVEEWLEKNLEASWNSPQIKSDNDPNRLTMVKTFSHGLPHQSPKWRRRAMEYAEQGLSILKNNRFTNLNLLNQRFTAHLSRASLMLADHYYSQGKAQPNLQSDNYHLIANTEHGVVKQKLDEHNIGVAISAREIANALPKLRASLPDLEISTDSLIEQKIPKSAEELFRQYGWQNKAIKVGANIYDKAKNKGFFGVNMASTGKGKTIANAKILYALGSKRFNVALGLRTLTLQTGTSFQKDLELDDDQLATLVGGIAVKELYQLDQQEDAPFSGSESSDEITDVEVYSKFKNVIKHALSEWTQHDERIEKLLSAPVLVSTIDHLIPATEGTRGGKQIGPMLRLLTSDLILDEPDDFGLEDLPALSRLVNWAGMLGRKVLLSSATMPPALVNALFRSYKQGREDYLKVNASETAEQDIACAWFDEFDSNFSLLHSESDFSKTHKKFVSSRIKQLESSAHIKRGALLTIEGDTKQSEQEIRQQIADTFYEGMQSLHHSHALEKDGKTLSVGLIRMANIDPLVAISRLLIEREQPDDTHIHYCVYHSRYPLAVRSHLESKLDTILKRTDESAIWEHSDIHEKIQKHPNKKNHIFVVLASPVAEVGRDHDYDWAIAEPSSMRSIIQLAGRVMRHRSDKPIQTNDPNILILQKNITHLDWKLADVRTL